MDANSWRRTCLRGSVLSYLNDLKLFEAKCGLFDRRNSNSNAVTFSSFYVPVGVLGSVWYIRVFQCREVSHVAYSDDGPRPIPNRCYWFASAQL